jgi:hypothetical protein
MMGRFLCAPWERSSGNRGDCSHRYPMSSGNPAHPPKRNPQFLSPFIRPEGIQLETGFPAIVS